ncbi:hypothetical protein B0H15DRAFT_794753 [Mycena belliarum]|uniref:Uncharacterized protein n=1 Tax=Mycena belliarum TaxID=1033014 RepID=A0AAD6XHA0_9AGAR|nr:hypothetical protein B0H15DRAFT_794753 [Mycena belliae]
MRHLVGFGNRRCGSVELLTHIDLRHSGLLQLYCSAAFSALAAEKKAFLEHDPRALYPSDASVFSAATFELGGPHSRTHPSGTPYRHQAAGWSILTALGSYSSMRGGHIILWDLGLVVSFPVGSSILIPTGLVRYSFVTVRPNERRYSLLQWAGSGIPRWFRNGKRSDVEFAVNATREEHVAREERRQAAHAEALDLFPIEAELPDDCDMSLPFMWEENAARKNTD